MLALGVRLAHAFLVAADLPMPGDALVYRLVGDELAHGFSYSRAGNLGAGETRPTAEHPPLFPLYLSLWDRIGLDGVGAERIECALLGTLTVGLIGLIGRRAGGDRLGLLAAALAAVYPPLVLADASLTSESLYAPLVAAAMLLAFTVIDRQTVRWAAALGAVIGLCTLTRSDGLLQLPLLGLPVAWRVRSARWIALAACISATLVVLAPWLARNWVRFDRPLLSTNGGYTALAANCPTTYYSSEYIGFVRHQCVFRSRCTDIRDELAASDCMAEEARSYARLHLGRVALVVLARAGRMWELFHAEATYDYGLNWARARWVAQLSRYATLVALAFALVGGIALRRRAVPLLPLVAPLVAATVVAALTFGFSRYRLVAEPAVVVLASAGLAWLWGLRRGSKPAEAQPHEVVQHPQRVTNPANP